MSRIINSIKKNYTIIPNEVLGDKNLSLKAKGLISYLISLPVDWEIYKSELKNHFKDGKDSINSAFDELINAGYIIQEEKDKQKGQFGGYNYVIINPNEENPMRENRNGSSVTVNPPLINTYNKQNTDKQIELSKDNSLVGLPSSTPTGESSSDDKELPSEDKELPISERARNFVNYFNEIRKNTTGLKGKFQLTNKVERMFRDRVKKFKPGKIAMAVINAHKDPYHVENNFKYITPEFILREDKLEKFANMVFDDNRTISSKLVH